MTNAKPFTGQMLTVESQWTDYNGHLNMAYYAVLFDRAAEELFQTFGLGPEYVKATNCTFFTLETHTSYANELLAGDQVRIETQIIASDQKRVHYVQQMFRGDTSYLACVLEVMVSHVDLTTHRTSVFPPEIQAKIDGMTVAHKAITPPPQVGHLIGLPPKRG
jgi:acyl-CoA thioester hydrolase